MPRNLLTDQQWSILQPQLRQRRGPKSPRRDRTFVDAVIWVARTGAPWRDLDAEFGPWKPIYNRFRRWAIRGWWSELFSAANKPETVGSILDASIVRAHQDSCGGKGGPAAQAIGRSRGGFSSKIHVVVTLQAKPLEIRVTPGQQHEVTVAEELLSFVRGSHCLADRAYDADEFLGNARRRGLRPVIPPSKSRKRARRYNQRLYKLRYRVEIFFHQLKRYRRIATRFDKTLTIFLAFIHLVCLRLSL